VTVRGVISILLLIGFVYLGWEAGFWAIMNTWIVQDWAVVAFLVGASWWISNDLGRGGG
jgi:hypothetical protein